MDEPARRREINEVMRHDVRTRVAIGKGYVAMLTAHYDQLTPDQRAAALAGVGDAFDRLDEFSRRVLLAERLDAADVEPAPAALPLAGVADLARGLGAAVEILPGAPASAWADPVLLREVLDNLVGNARAAAPPGTTVLVRLGGAGDALRVEVRDEGAALTEADRPELFRRWGRTARSRETRAAGLGLGLWIVRGLVEAHGGRYGVDLDGGTTFWVELPVSPNGVRSPVGT